METADVVIVGAGIIGAAIAFELAKRGHATVSVDANAGPSLGPTSNSCAIVRSHYSTLEGVAMAYEGFRYWQEWADYLGVADEAGMAVYRQCGTATLKSRSGHHLKYLPHYRALGVEFEEWDAAELKRRVPVLDTREFWPPRRPEDPSSGDEPETRARRRGVYTPGSGYVNDPSARRPQPGGGRDGTRRALPLPHDRDRHPARRRPGRRRRTVRRHGHLRARVVNVAGPHSFLVNRMAGVEAGMNRRTRALRHEVHHVAGAARLGSRRRRHPRLRRRSRHLLQARRRQHPPAGIGGSRPATRTTGSTTPTLPTATSRAPSGRRRSSAWLGACRRSASRGARVVRRPLRLLGRLDPDLRPLRPARASTWRSARRATSSRTRALRVTAWPS